MAFETFLGNEQLKTNLARSISGGHISHFYLISGPRGSGKRTLARLLGAAILCSGEEKPCLRCSVCRKVMADSHPDFITVDDTEHKTVTVGVVRNARKDMFIRPNESDYKIYVIPRGQDLGPEGQNALLKILEEPPQYGVFILLADNPNKLLPTVRSRCTELKLHALPEALLSRQLKQDFPKAQEQDIAAAVFRSGGFYGQARQLLQDGDTVPPQTGDFVRALCAKDALLLTRTLVPMEKWKRDALLPMLTQWLELTESALACRSGLGTVSAQARQLAEARSSRELYAVIGHLKKAVLYGQSNVSPAAICGYLLWMLQQ